jgi:uncharacterized membrane protein YhaH (DUF805 family)
MDFGQAIQSCFHRYATFVGRAPRSEYWYFILFTCLVSIVAGVLDVAMFGDSEIFNAIAAIALLLPTLAVTVRRLHDKDYSGWWVLLSLIPLIGAIVLVVWFCQRGTVGPNRFGPDPLMAGSTAASLART